MGSSFHAYCVGLWRDCTSLFHNRYPIADNCNLAKDKKTVYYVHTVFFFVLQCFNKPPHAVNLKEGTIT